MGAVLIRFLHLIALINAWRFSIEQHVSFKNYQRYDF